MPTDLRVYKKASFEVGGSIIKERGWVGTNPNLSQICRMLKVICFICTFILLYEATSKFSMALEKNRSINGAFQKRLLISLKFWCCTLHSTEKSVLQREVQQDLVQKDRSTRKMFSSLKQSAI